MVESCMCLETWTYLALRRRLQTWHTRVTNGKKWLVMILLEQWGWNLLKWAINRIYHSILYMIKSWKIWKWVLFTYCSQLSLSHNQLSKFQIFFYNMHFSLCDHHVQNILAHKHVGKLFSTFYPQDFGTFPSFTKPFLPNCFLTDTIVCCTVCTYMIMKCMRI